MSISQAPATIASHELQVLLVEPDEETRLVLEMALQARGHRVTAGGDAVGAWRALQRYAYPLVLVNRRLPDVDGLRLVRQMRAVPNGAGSVILMISSAVSPEDRAASLEAGADDYLGWPDDAVTFRAHLEAIEQRAAEAARSAALGSPSESATLFVLSADGAIREAGPAADALGYAPEALVGRNAFGLFHPEDAPRVLAALARALASGEPAGAVTLRLRGQDEQWHALDVSTANRARDADGGLVLSVPQPRPAALEQEAESEEDAAARDAIYDELTHLPSYALFMDRLEHALARASRRGEPVVTLALDFDGLAEADDRYGAGAADQLIVVIGQRAQSCLRAGDTIARVGRHELAFIIEGVLGLGDATPIAQRIVRELEVPVMVNGAGVTLTPNLGIAMSQQDRYGAADLLRQARAARDYARHNPVVGGHYALYEASMDHPAPPEAEPAELLDEPTAPLDAGVPAEAWFSPLLDRISSLEREIARLTTEQRAHEDGDGA